MAQKSAPSVGKREELLSRLYENRSYKLKQIVKALDFATEAHMGVFRKSGEPYIEHPINVALILVELGMDSESVIAGLLHDVVEDTEVTSEEIRKNFGKEVMMLVDGVTKLGKIPYYSREEQQAENIRKMLFAMAEDVRVIIIKLADRLHNMRTIGVMSEQKRRDKSLETIELYAPIAHRLGIRGIKDELEDLCLKQLDPVAYDDISETISVKEQGNRDFLNSVQNKIQKRVKPILGEVYIESRIKSVYGIYRKMFMQSKTIDEIYDIYAVRIIVDSVNDCYNVLGIVHDMFRPIPGRFKDYISNPKQNRYQSLHTTVFDSDGTTFEIQIRSWEMHRTAEYGIAAHWKYKEGISKSNTKVDESLTWIRQLLEAQKESDDAEELIRNIKTDLTLDETFALTPRGDVISLPIGSTVIDFAYAIHSAVGNKMVGAKVDGRIVPIDYEIKNGQIVEILTTKQPDHGPGRDWLNIVKTSEARTKIRSWFKKERRDENIVEGKSAIEKNMRRDLLSLPDDKKSEFYEKMAKIYHCNTVDDFFAMIGYGGLPMSRLMPRVRDEYNRNYKNVIQEISVNSLTGKQKKTVSKEGIVIEGIDNCLVHFSKCCSPLPGDEIVGFITRGHGVSIHKRDCPNVPKNISDANEPDRWVNAFWIKSKGEMYMATLKILAVDSPVVLADVTTALAGLRIAIHSINAKKLKEGNYQIIVTVSCEGTSHLENIIHRLEQVNNVFSIERMLTE